ncbi:hypothetical protein KI387_013859, partial [Taxus chinensis]
QCFEWVEIIRNTISEHALTTHHNREILHELLRILRYSLGEGLFGTKPMRGLAP